LVLSCYPDTTIYRLGAGLGVGHRGVWITGKYPFFIKNDAVIIASTKRG